MTVKTDDSTLEDLRRRQGEPPMCCPQCARLIRWKRETYKMKDPRCWNCEKTYRANAGNEPR